MHDIAFMVVLVAAFMHAAWNALVKINASALLVMSAMFGCTSLMLLFYVPWVDALPLALMPWWLLSLALHFGYKIYLVKALSLGHFSQAYPIARGSAPLWVLLVSYMVLPQDFPSLRFMQAIGAISIVVGIILLTPWQRLIGQQSLINAALITGGWIAGYTLVDGYVISQHGYLISFVFWLFFFDGVIMNIYAYTRHRQALWQVYRLHWGTAVLGGGLSLLAYSLSLWAMTILPVVMVSALRETSVLAAVLIARWWLKEPLTDCHYAAALLICAGLVMSKLA